MATTSTIEWTDVTWNPSTGCSKVSTGCKYCYAETMTARLQAMGCRRYDAGFDFVEHRDKIDEPLRWRKPRKVFVNSMSDLFHEEASYDFLRSVFDVMQRTPRHQFQVLTKRPERMRDVLHRLKAEGDYQPAGHIWLGTSVENADASHRIQALQEVPAVVRFLSCEPLLGPLQNLDLSHISWVIVGGESGKHLWKEKARSRRALVCRDGDEWIPREDRVSWVSDLRDSCQQQGVAFFFKQWGGPRPKQGGRQLDGRTWDEYPEQTRESVTVQVG